MRNLIKYAQYKKYKYLYADIREDNIRSQKLFETLGFQCTKKYKLVEIENSKCKIKMNQYVKQL